MSSWIIQESYALCRVFMKSATAGAKIIEHYGSPRVEQLQWKPADSHTAELSSDRIKIGEEFGSRGSPSPSETHSSETIQGSTLDASASENRQWMQYLSEEAFATGPPFHDPACFPCTPRKVKVFQCDSEPRPIKRTRRLEILFPLWLSVN